MKRLRVSAVLIAVSIGWLLIGTALVQAEKVSDMDQQFLQQAAHAGTAEVKLGAMAAERATSPEVQLFWTASESKDPDIKAFTAKTLPTLQEHLQMARQLAQQLKVSLTR